MSMTGPRAAAPDPQTIPTTRLVATLGVAGAVAGLLIVVAYQSTLPAIEAHREARIEAALEEVLAGAVRYETFYVVGGRITAAAPADHGMTTRRVYAGYDEGGAISGFAVGIVAPGFQDPIELLVGLDPRTRTSLGVSILSSRETPGLGDKILRPEWLAQFARRTVPLIGKKPGGTPGPSEVDMITGATISSRAVISAVNKTVDEWAPLLSEHVGGDRP